MFLFIIIISLISHKQIIYYYFNKRNIFVIKPSDYFNFRLLNKTYEEISHFLNNKYNNNNSKKIKKNKKKKRINLFSVDLFSFKNHIRWLKSKLSEHFIIKLNSQEPDYLLFNNFGRRHLNKKYNNAIKIAILTENRIPDLNYSDYALGHSHIFYLDKYFKHSILLWANYKNIHKIREQVLNQPLRKKFCAAVISNSFRGDRFRLKFINELNKYKKVDMGGKYKNNIGGKIKNKIEFLSSYKFSIAMENSEGDGYVSEKIIHSFISGTIPIYYGDYMIDEYINPKTYILIKGEKDLRTKINYIKEIDNNEKQYRKILKENVIIDENFAVKIDNELKAFLYNIFIQDKQKAFRRLE